MRYWMLALSILPAPLIAGPGQDPVIPAGFDLATLTAEADDRDDHRLRLIPVDEPAAEPPARLRLRGTRVKIRVPIG